MPRKSTCSTAFVIKQCYLPLLCAGLTPVPVLNFTKHGLGALSQSEGAREQVLVDKRTRIKQMLGAVSDTFAFLIGESPSLKST